MKWVTIVWSMSGAISWTVGVMYLLVWLQQRKNFAYLLFAISAVGVACFALF